MIVVSLEMAVADEIINPAAAAALSALPATNCASVFLVLRRLLLRRLGVGLNTVLLGCGGRVGCRVGVCSAGVADVEACLAA